MSVDLRPTGHPDFPVRVRFHDLSRPYYEILKYGVLHKEGRIVTMDKGRLPKLVRWRLIIREPYGSELSKYFITQLGVLTVKMNQRQMPSELI
jgi:hypothetical protein